MNRSILIVICDFLLVSLLAFSNFDPDALTRNPTTRQPKLSLTLNGPENRQEAAAVLKLALEDEQLERDKLFGELTRTRDVIGQQRTALQAHERQLAQRDQELGTVRKALEAREQQAQQLARDKTWLEQQIAFAQTNLQAMQRQITSTANEAALSRELAGLSRDELRREQERAAVLQQLLGQLEKSNQVVLAERQQLATRLEVSEAEKRAASENVVRMQDEVKVVRQEKERLTQQNEKLADGVKTLASKSGDLAQEIHENRALSPNTIFSDLATNRIDARFHAYRPGALGMDHVRRKDTQTILVSDGTNCFALCHVDETCLTLGGPSADWLSLTGYLSNNSSPIPITAVSFALMDPRVVLIPITLPQAKELGCKIYPIARDSFKFQEAVLVGVREGYYGECKFELDLNTPHYVKMDRSVFRGLFGKFNPSRGDLVFSRTGELLGVMVNNTYCLRLLNFSSLGSLQFGQDVREQHTGQLLARLRTLVEELPPRLR